jgi:putative exporter of polyketide antibiotics
MGMGNIDLASMAFTADTYIAIEFLMFWPLIVCFYAIFAGVSISREVERGTLDLLLAQPVSRTRVLISKYAVPLTGIILIALFSWRGWPSAHRWRTSNSICGISFWQYFTGCFCGGHSQLYTACKCYLP